MLTVMKLVQMLTALSGVSGWEDAVRDCIALQAQNASDSLTVDRLGNLIVTQTGSEPDGRTLLLCSHMDEVGFIIKEITSEGFLRFGLVGGIDTRLLPGRPVQIGPNSLPGVIGCKPKHLLDKSATPTAPRVEDLYIDIGAECREEVSVSPGDRAVFDAPFVPLGDDLLCAKALDDRVGCAALLHLMLSTVPKRTRIFAFTAQEEVGLRGAAAVTNRLRPTAAVVVDITTAADLPHLPSHKRVCVPGRGVVLPHFDRATHYDPALLQTACAVAQTHHIPYQHKEFLAGGTDAGAIQRTGDGIPVVGFALAGRYLHGPSSVVSRRDIAALTDLLALFVKEWEA